MLKFENPTNGRFYYLEVTNELVIRIVFGGRRVCRMRTIICDNRDKLLKEFDRLSKRRLKRGYVLIH
jgi:hypothetical protein